MKRKKIGGFIHFYDKKKEKKNPFPKNFKIKNFHWDKNAKYVSNELFSVLNSLIIIDGRIINEPILTKINVTFVYVKINYNQMRIIDALFNDGGKEKKYINFRNKDEHLFSEHSGLLNILDGKFEHFIISAKTDRISDKDKEIYLPTNNLNSQDFQYIFHTHPVTPKIGSRLENEILYEFPSLNDIIHFIENAKYGVMLGSIVISPEGTYLIRQRILGDKSTVPPSSIVKQFFKVQTDYIKKYVDKNFDEEFFYNTVAYDFSAIDRVNALLKTYNIYIEYYPREYKNNMWCLRELILPIYTFPNNNK